jgi:hypothetical protein
LRNIPTIPAEYPGIGYAQVGSYVNTLRAIDPAAGYDNSENNTILTTLSLEQQIPWVKGLSVKGVFAYDKRMNYSKDGVIMYMCIQKIQLPETMIVQHITTQV